MSLAELSVRRPVMTTMVSLIVVVLGLVSLSRLQIDLLPEIELPTLTVRTEYQGASPEVMEQRVTRIIEEIIATVPGVEEIKSVSAEGTSNVEVTFAWGTDIDTAALDVQGKIEDEISELPDNIVRPRVSKFDISSFPVVLLGIESRLDPVELTTLVEEQIRYRMSQIPGVAQVDPWGGYEREVRIELDPAKVRALKLPLNDVLSAIRDANVDLPAGELDEGKKTVTLRAPSQFADLDQIRDTVVAIRKQAPIRLGQIATVQDTYQKLDRIARVNGEMGVRVAIRKESNENTVEVSQRILAEVERINRDFPQIHVVPVINQGNFIERSINNVARSVLYGGALAVLVLLLFLRNLRSTAVIALAIPISLIATFALVFFGGLTLNLMTLGGLALGVGMMVDNSIVVLENIFRRRDELGEPTATAAVKGTNEVSSAIVASTITTLVIFLPIVFLQGVTGVLFKDLAYVIVFSLACSLVVSLSLVPMVSSKLLRDADETSSSEGTSSGKSASWSARLIALSAGALGHLETAYQGVLRTALQNRWTTVMIAAIACGASLLLVPAIGTEFLPPSDEGEVRVTGEMPVGTRLGLVDRQTRLMESHVYDAVPESVSSVVSVGSSGYRPDEASRGEISLSLTPAADRERSNSDIAADLRRQLAGKVPGMEIRTRAPQGQFLLERILGGEEGLTIEVRGYELSVLDRLAQQVERAISDVPGLTDLQVSREAAVPQHEIRTDRDRAADLGLTPRDVATSLETAIAGSEAGEYRERGNSYRILVQLADAENLPLSEVLDMMVSDGSGRAIPLRNVVSNEKGYGPILIDRKDQQRLVTVRANTAGRDLGSIVGDVEKRLADIARPAGYEFNVAGNVEEQQKAFNELSISLLLALVLVYMVLAGQYESLRAPFAVMLSVPVAGVGVLLVLALTGTTLNVQSFIGCIMLGGIVVNNAILLVDQTSRLRSEGLDVRPAVAEAGRRRLRPILMTTLTTVLALLPLSLGIGEGADAQAPMARAVLGGLAASTLITLVLIPTVYALIYRDNAPRDPSLEPSAAK